MDTFESCMMDILGDVGIYMDEASKESAKDCPGCEGTGETPVPEIGSREMYMQMLAAVARDSGGSSTVQVAGDPCPKCEGTGKVYDDVEILTRAARAVAKDWRDELRIALAQTIEARDMAIETKCAT